MGAGPAFRSSLAVRLALVLLVVATLGMAIMGLYVTRVLETHSVDSLKAGLVTEAGLVHDAAAPLLRQGAPASEVQELAERLGVRSRARVTIIARDGTVLGDSQRTLREVSEMENHAHRPEVQAALAGLVGHAVRRSRTLDLEMLYVAVPLEESRRVTGALRLALPLTEVAQASSAIRKTVATGAVLAFAVACAVGVFISRRVTRPVAEMRAVAQELAEGNLQRRVPAQGDDQIADLGRALNVMAERLAEKIQHLEGERAKVAAILNNMGEAVIALDARGRILLANPGARSLFALGAVAVEGRPFVEVIRQTALFDLVEACQAGGGAGRCRREIELGPPINRILEAHAVPVDFRPREGGSLLVLHDVTELRRLERIRAEFVANVSHELRTPLTSIRGYLETLLDGALDEPANARRFLEVAHSHAVRLGRLVDDLLQLAAVETGRLQLKPVTLVLREVVDEVAAIFEGTVTQKKLDLRNRVPPELLVKADPDRLVQLLVNLVDNAVKYTPAGGSITLGAALGPSGVVEMSVADTGAGIPSTELPRVTERFYRVDKARSRAEGGTGLGLAIVKHLVQAHGGELRIESALGKGTTARVTLPSA